MKSVDEVANGYGNAEIARAAHTVLDGRRVRHLDPRQGLFAAMLDGWDRQQTSRQLAPGTRAQRMDVVRRFAAFTGSLPWQWTPSDVEDWTAHLRSAPTPRAHSTGRGYHNTVALLAYVTDQRYDWAQRCDTPTLCTQWRVRDLVAHVYSHEDLSLARVATRMLRTRFDNDRANTIGVINYATLTPTELLARARDHIQPRGLTALMGGRIALTDGMILPNAWRHRACVGRGGRGWNPQGMSVGPRAPRRVFLSHTSELRDYPRSGSFVAEAESAVAKAGDAVVDMQYFAARDQLPAQLCRDKIAAADVFVLIAGFRYGSPVRDEQEVSYTELEYATATDLGLPRLVFLLGEDTEGPAALTRDLDHGQRQEAFRRRLLTEGPVVVTVTSPAELESELRHALSELTASPRREAPGPALADELRAGYLAAIAARYRVLDLATLNPEAADEQVSVRLAQVFVPPQVRAKPPEVELPRQLWRRLVECGELGAGELPAQVDRELLVRARQAHLGQSAQPVLAMLAGAQRLVALLGDPGAGKSSLLRYLALALATGDLPAELTGWAGWLPILVELRAYADPSWSTGRGGDATLLNYLDYLYQEGVGLPRDVLDRFLREDGRAVVMFDGLDELFDPTQREATARRIAGFAAHYPQVRVIVTSRPIGYRRATLDGAGFALHGLQDLDRDQIITFVHTWYRIAYGATPTDAHDRAARLLAGLDRSPSVADLAGNPMLLTILAVIGRRRELPRERHQVYRHALEVLVQHWDINRALHDTRVPMDYLDETDKRALLRRIARGMQDGHAGIAGNHIARDHLLAAFRDYLTREYQLPADQSKRVAVAIVEQLRERNFILARFGPGLYGFMHRAFLEYCCAEEIIHQVKETQQLSAADLATAVFEAHATDPAWQEVLLLVAGMIHESLLARVLDHLLDLAAGPAGRLGQHAGQHLVLALRCLSEARSLTKLDAQAREAVRELIDLLNAARYAVTVDPYGATPPALASVLAAVPLLKDLGPSLPGGKTYQDWFHHLPPPASAYGLRIELIRATYWIAIAASPGRAELRIKLTERAATTTSIAAVRQVAVEVLAAGWPDVHTRSVLTNLATTDPDGDDWDVRAAAVKALATGWPDEHTRTLLTEVTTDPNEDVRQAAVRALATGWPDEHTRSVLTRLATADPDDWDVRAAAVEALATGWPDEQTRVLLTELTINDDRTVQEVAIGYLVANWPDEHTRDLLERVAAKNVAAAVAALAWGWPDEHTRDLLERATTAYYNDARAAAVDALAQGWPGEHTRDLLVRATTDQTQYVRQVAVHALAQDLPDEDTRTLLTEWATTAKHADVREAAVRALARGWPDEHTRDLLKRANTDQDSYVRFATLQALVTGWPDEHTRSVLTHLATTDHDDAIREAAMHALAAGWPDQRTRALLTERVATDPGEDIRQAAAQTLASRWPDK